MSFGFGLLEKQFESVTLNYGNIGRAFVATLEAKQSINH